jgi:hypothetical protein
MAFSFRWTIENVTGYPQRNGLNEVVATVSWQLEVRQISDGSIHMKRGTTNLLDPDPDNFTDYLELDPEEILSWVWSTLEGGRTAFEEATKQELISLLSPPLEKETQFDMPWLTNCCPDTDPVTGSPGFKPDGTPPDTIVQDIRS